MQPTIDPTLLAGLSVYQDVVIAGQVVHRGARDCAARWELIDPWLPSQGVFLDVGSNFGWFALRLAASRPAAVIASLEADLRSAAVQREVLASHATRRIALATRAASTARLQRWHQTGQRFDGALCLAVLHWLPDPARFMKTLGSIAKRLVVELPSPDEQGAGLPAACRVLADPQAFLAHCLPGRRLRELGQVHNHRQPGAPRTLWGVDVPDDDAPYVSPGLLVEPLLDHGLCWPPRRWWQGEWAGATRDLHAESLVETPSAAGPWFTAHGLCVGAPTSVRARRRLDQRLARLPDGQLLNRWERLPRTVRATAARVWSRGKVRLAAISEFVCPRALRSVRPETGDG